MATAKEVDMYTADDIQVLEGMEAVRKRPRHVHRKHRPARTSPPHLRDCG